MTSNKAFKSRVRARMDKTGEAYTTARRHLLPHAEDVAAGPAPEVSIPAAGDNPAGVKALRLPDSAMLARTGRDIGEWFDLLDGWSAAEHSHSEIARWLTDVQRIDGWWAQSITVQYEQARGLREPGQSRSGFFSTSSSRTIAAPVDRVFAAFADPALREQWLPGAGISLRTATSPKSYRADWTADSTRIVVVLDALGAQKSRVNVTHERLSSAEDTARMKAMWRERLLALKGLLEA